jgi:hypothetical protein
MQDAPDKLALLTGVAQFLNGELAPQIPDRDLRFRVRISAYLLQQVLMELAFDEQQDAGELQRLGELLNEPVDVELPTSQRHARLRELKTALAARIREEGADEATRAHVMKTLRDQLAVVQPRFDTRLNVEG